MGLIDRFFGRGKSLHPLADRLLADAAAKASWGEVALKDLSSGAEFLDLSREGQLEVARSLIGHAYSLRATQYGGKDWRAYQTLTRVMGPVLNRKLPFEDRDLVELLTWMSESSHPYGMPFHIGVKALENFSAASEPSSALIEAAKRLRDGLVSGDADARAYAARLGETIREKPTLPMVAGDLWADRAIEDLNYLEAEACGHWTELLTLCQTATGGSPSKKWLDAMGKILEKIPEEEVIVFFSRWFPLAQKPSSENRVREQYGHRYSLDPWMMVEVNQDILKGLVWACRLVRHPDIPGLIAPLCVSAFKKVPGIGPRAVRLGNACINTLGAMEGTGPLAQMALIKVKVKNRTTQNQIQKALEAAADRAGVTPDELEEMSVPDYGLTEVGVLEMPMGEFTARLEVGAGNSTELIWVKPDGKTQKSVPASVKESHAESLAELNAAAKDIQKMLPAIRERIDGLFLRQRAWTLDEWKARYHDHALVGHLARRLIWRFESDAAIKNVIWYDGRFVDCQGEPYPLPDGEGAAITVAIWHPLDSETDEVLDWRNWLEAHQVQQPFKQAHREIYTLTAAEEGTRTYSNRYAAHVLKQHQFNALCLARDWRNRLRLMVDDEYPPASRDLPGWGLRAEYWIEGIGSQWGTDVNESGTYFYLATDQVRFYPIDADQVTAHAGGGGYGGRWSRQGGEPLPLSEIPALVFSEIMRDVDLFVGVASVANDPNWSDGGPRATHRDYWQAYSFGDLNASASTRKEVLERLLPRLKIREAARIEGKFLIVKGKVRTYKIHLGSGNILMEPNDQYLCIVPNAAQRRGSDKVFLPFEGDNVMSIILSKAFLLAEDDKIKDPTILSQIGKR